MMASSLEQTPALHPPPGMTSNLLNPESLWKWDVLCVTICLFFTTVPFVLRTYTRIFIKKIWIFEDYMTCLSWAGLVIYCGLMTTVMDKHGGIHEWDLTLPDVEDALYWFNVTSIEYGLEILITKLTILMLYRRVFIPRRWSIFDITLRLFEAVLIFFYVAISLVKIFECTPRARIWNKKIPGTCADVSKILNTSGLFNFFTDVLILLVPVKSVWNLHMKKTKKTQVIAIFTVGSIAPVFSMIGFIVRLRDSSSPDATYNQPFVLLWGTAEVSTGVLITCLPPLSALLRRSQRRPTAMIINGESILRRTQSSKKKGPRSNADLDLYHEEYLELRGRSSHSVTTHGPVEPISLIQGKAKFAKIKDGSLNEQDTSPTNSRDKRNTSVRGADILKTVRIENSYMPV